MCMQNIQAAVNVCLVVVGVQSRTQQMQVHGLIISFITTHAVFENVHTISKYLKMDPSKKNTNSPLHVWSVPILYIRRLDDTYTKINS